MIIVIKTALACLVPFAAGFLALRILSSDNRPGFGCGLALALAYGVGMGILAQVMLWLGIVRFPYSTLSISSMLVLLIGIFILIIARDGKRTFFAGTSLPSCHRPWTSRILFAAGATLIALNIYVILILIFMRPVSGWDSLATILFKSKILFYERSLFFLNGFPHERYPMQIPFSVAWLSIVADQWNDQIFPPLIYTGYLLSMIFGSYFLLRRLDISKGWSLMYSILLLSSDFFLKHTTLFYCDFPLAYYNLFAMLFLMLWGRERRHSWLILAAVFSGMGAFVKLEGVIYSGIHVLTLFFLLWISRKEIKFKQTYQSLAGFMGTLGVLIVPFLIFKLINLPGGNSGGFSLSHLDLAFSTAQFSGMISYLGQNLFLSGNWNILWFIFVFCLCFYLFRKCEMPIEVKAVLFALSLFFVLILFGFSSTSFYYDVVRAKDPLSRIILHGFPLAPLFIVVTGNLISSSGQDDEMS